MSDTTLNSFLASGTHAQRLAFVPAPATPAAGNSPTYFWYEDDTGLSYAWNFATASWHLVGAINTSVGIVIDGGGSLITSGIKGDLYCPVGFSITGVVMLADQVGSIVVDIWSAAYGAYPPTVANTITAAALPTITAAVKSKDTVLTGWTKVVPADNTLRFNVNAGVVAITRLTLSLLISLT